MAPPVFMPRGPRECKGKQTKGDQSGPCRARCDRRGTKSPAAPGPSGGIRKMKVKKRKKTRPTRARTNTDTNNINTTTRDDPTDATNNYMGGAGPGAGSAGLDGPRRVVLFTSVNGKRPPVKPSMTEPTQAQPRTPMNSTKSGAGSSCLDELERVVLCTLVNGGRRLAKPPMARSHQAQPGTPKNGGRRLAKSPMTESTQAQPGAPMNSTESGTGLVLLPRRRLVVVIDDEDAANSDQSMSEPAQAQSKEPAQAQSDTLIDATLSVSERPPVRPDTPVNDTESSEHGPLIAESILSQLEACMNDEGRGTNTPPMARLTEGRFEIPLGGDPVITSGYPPMAHPTPVRPAPVHSLIADAPAEAPAQSDYPHPQAAMLLINPTPTFTDTLRAHLLRCMIGYSLGMGLTSVHMCYLPEIILRLDHSLPLRAAVYFFCFAWGESFRDTRQDIAATNTYRLASHSIRDELKSCTPPGDITPPSELITPDVLAAMALTERTLKLFGRGRNSHRFSVTYRNAIGEVLLAKGPPDLTDPLDMAVSHECYALMCREPSGVDMSPLSEPNWKEALTLCAKDRPTCMNFMPSDERPYMMNDNINLHEYTSKLEPMIEDLRQLYFDMHGREGNILARKIRQKLQLVRDASLLVNACSRIAPERYRLPRMHAVERYYGKRFYLRAVLLAHIFQRMLVYDVVPFQVVYEMSLSLGRSDDEIFRYFDEISDPAQTGEIWERVPLILCHEAREIAESLQAANARNRGTHGDGAVMNNALYHEKCPSADWYPDTRRILNYPFNHLTKIRVNLSLHGGHKL